MLFSRLFKCAIGLVYGVNLFALIISISAPYYNPRYLWWPSAFGLLFKILLLVHLSFILIFFIGRLKPLAWFSAFMLLFTVPAFIHTTALKPFGSDASVQGGIKLLTYNIDNFGYYKDTTHMAAILETIKKENPDIACFQEYLRVPGANAFLTRMEKSGYHYYYEYFTDSGKTGDKLGQATFSRLPLLHFHAVPFHHTTNGAFCVDIPDGKDTFRLFNVHLQSIALSGPEFKIPSSLKDFQYPQKGWYRMLFVKMRWAFRRRSYQALDIKREIEKSPYKVIVSGDFNDTPLSFTYHELTEKLDDTYLRSNFGIGTTFAGKIPFQRIDYILTDPTIKTSRTTVLHVAGSDHFPLITRFQASHP